MTYTSAFTRIAPSEVKLMPLEVAIGNTAEKKLALPPPANTLINALSSNILNSTFPSINGTFAEYEIL